MTRERIDDVLVVGGGIIGLAIAREAARRGLRVRLLEKGAIGHAASRAAAGLLAPQVDADRPSPLLDLCLRSRDLYPEFARAVAEESGVDPSLADRGTLVVARGGAEARALDRCCRFQRSLGLAVERLDAGALRRLEPSLRDTWRAGLYLPRDLSVDNVLLVRGLRMAAERSGARLAEGVPVDRLLVEDGRVRGAGAGPVSFPAGAVVVAAGAWSGGIAGPGIAPVPSHPVRGQILCLGPARAPSVAIYRHDGYLVPRRDGRVLAGSTMERAGFDASVTDAALAALRRRAAALVPALADAPTHSAWAGLRPATPDGLPAIGAAGVPGLVYACGHLRNGILLAPVTAAIVVRLLRGEDPGMDLSAFDPRRFEEGRGDAAGRRRPSARERPSSRAAGARARRGSPSSGARPARRGGHRGA